VDALACTFADNPEPLEIFTFDQADHLLKKCVEILQTDKFQAHLHVALTVLKHLLDLFKGNSHILQLTFIDKILTFLKTYDPNNDF
jgi:hypothetical protein